MSVISFFPVVYIILLALVYLLFYRTARSGLKRFIIHWLLPATIIGGWLLYYRGYELANYGGMLFRVFMTTYSTARLFILDNDLDVFYGYVKDDKTFLLWFSVIVVSAVFISISFLLDLLGRRLLSSLKIRACRSTDNYIFFGVNNASFCLASDLLKNEKSRFVLFVKSGDKDDDLSLLQSIDKMGALIVSLESIEDKIVLQSEDYLLKSSQTGLLSSGIVEKNKTGNLKRLRLLKRVLQHPSHFFFLSDKEEKNVLCAQSVFEELQCYTLEHLITFHIKIVAAELENLYIKTFACKSESIQIKFINVNDLESHFLVRSNNPVDWVSKNTEKAMVTSDFNILIIGFNEVSESVLRRLIVYGQFPGATFTATILDYNMEAKKGRFENYYPGIISNYHVDFVETVLGSSSFFNQIKQGQTKWDYIVVSLEHESLNLRTAIDISQLYHCFSEKKVKILTRIKRNDTYSFKSDSLKSVSLVTFGDDCEIYTERIIICSCIEACAKKIHGYYQLNSKKMKPWEKLSSIEQYTNIEAAEHIYTKLALSGLTVEQIKNMDDETAFVNYLGEERLINLAKAEHLHWNAILFTYGWNTWPISEIPGGASLNKDTERKLHACLVCWEELESVGQQFNQDFYKYDKENVVKIFDLVKSNNY